MVGCGIRYRSDIETCIPHYSVQGRNQKLAVACVSDHNPSDVDAHIVCEHMCVRAHLCAITCLRGGCMHT